jgi:endo-1,4-beta-xylanase
MLFRLGFSHHAVQAILLWGFGALTHWMGPDAALVSADGTLTAAGRRISHLLREEWTTQGEGVSAGDGRFAFRGFYGTYALRAAAPDGREIVREIPLTRSAPSATVQLAE